MIVLCGPSGSGKDTIRNIFLEQGFEKVLSTTSRPIRAGEEEGITYNYVTAEGFQQLLDEGYFAEHAIYNRWYYGIPKHALTDAEHKNKVLILEPQGLQIIKEQGYDIIPIFIKTSYDIREKRLYARGDNPEEIKRRLSTDDEDFKEVEERIFLRINNDYDTYEELEESVVEFIHKTLKPLLYW